MPRLRESSGITSETLFQPHTAFPEGEAVSLRPHSLFERCAARSRHSMSGKKLNGKIKITPEPLPSAAECETRVTVGAQGTPGAECCSLSADTIEPCKLMFFSFFLSI